MSEAEQQTQGTTGRLLAGRYRLGEVLGRGGMGTVWRARDETLGRTVAIKELRFSSNVDEDEKQRLITRTLREAKAIARIRSSGAVTVYDVVDEDDRPWIVMELIEGGSLADVIRDTGGLTPLRAAEVGLVVLDVLRAAHREGILHRDVKPSNVLISDDGRVVLTDFGIALVEGDPSVTSTGMLVGAPSYISPERARGQKPGPPADLWSLGGLLYACVEGAPPYDKGSALATLTAVMTEPLERPRNAGPLEEVIYGLLTKDPEHRLDDAATRALLNDVLNAPEADGPLPADATRTMAVPPPPEPQVPKGRKGTTGGKTGIPGQGGKPGKGAADGTARGAAAPAAAQPRPQGNGTGAGRQEGSTQTSPEQAAPDSAVKPPAGGPAEGQAPQDAGSGSARRKETEDRLQGALRAVRNAAGSGGSTPGRPAAAGAAAGTAEPPAGQPRTAGASLTGAVPKRTLAFAGVGLVAVVAGALLAFSSLGEGDADKGGASQNTPGSTAPGTSASASSGSSAGTGTADGAAKNPGGPASGSGAGNGNGASAEPGNTGNGENSGSGKENSGTGGLPDGYATVPDSRFHFTMALPEGWTRTRIAGYGSGGEYNRSRGALPKVQIDFTPDPGDDAVLAWERQEPSVDDHSTDYRRLSLEKAEYRRYPTVADWHFERTENGVRVHVLNRGFKVDERHGYSIMITCRKDAWDGDECTTLRDTAFKTFRPKD